MKKLYTLLMIVGVANLGFSQQKHEWKSKKAAGYAYNYVTNDPTQTRFYQLKNGLRVILSPNDQQPRINCFIAVRAGANQDPQNHTGLAHYLEHLLFKGTDKFGTSNWQQEKPLLDSITVLYEMYAQAENISDRKEIYKEIDRLSGRAAKYAISNEYDKAMATIGGKGTNAFTSYEQTVYVDNIPSNALANYLTIQVERFRNPIFRMFHTELETVYEEKNRALDNDTRKLEETMLRDIFKNHNYGKQTVLGSVEHLKNPSLTAIQQFYDTYYVPNNMAIILVGDLNPDDAIKQIAEQFGSWKSKNVVPLTFPKEEPLTDTLKNEVWGPTPESVRIAFRLPGLSDFRSTITATLADELMSNNTTGLIDLNLIKQQRILSGSSTIRKMKDYSVFVMNGTPKDGQSLDQVKDILLGQLSLLKKGNFSENDMIAVTNNFRRRSLESHKDNSSRSYNLLESFIISEGKNWHQALSIPDEMRKLTKADIMKFINETYTYPLVVYKKKGKDSNLQKIEKPNITPLVIDRNKQSDFMQSFNKIALLETQPQWIDYTKDLKLDVINNSKMYYVHNKKNELFSVVYRFNYGKLHDKKLAIAIEYLKLLNTEKYTSDQISKEMYQMASNYYFYVENRSLMMEVDGLQENMGKSLDYFHELMFECVPDEAILSTLKQRILKRREEAKLNKTNILKALTSYATYGPQNPNNYLLSNQEILDLKAEDLTDLIHRLLSMPKEVIYYGPTELSKIKEQLKLHIPRQTIISVPPIARFHKVRNETKKLFFVDYDMIQAEIQWIKNTTAFDSTLTPIISLYNNYMGGNMASVVFQTIREAKALAYTTYANYLRPDTQDEPYTLTAYIGTQADKLPEAIISMNEILTTLPESQQSFENSVKSLKNLLESDRVLPENIPFNYFQARDLGLTLDQRPNTYHSLKNLSFADLKKFHETITQGNFNYCLIASEKKVSLDELKKYGEIIKVSKEEIFGY